MSAHDFATADPGRSTHTTLPTRMAQLAADLYRSWRNRRAFYRLGEFSDAELADIGLTRTDLDAALATPLTSDPTARLRDLAAERIGSSWKGKARRPLGPA